MNCDHSIPIDSGSFCCEEYRDRWRKLRAREEAIQAVVALGLSRADAIQALDDASSPARRKLLEKISKGTR